MPVVPTAITAAINAQFAAVGFSGRNDFDIAVAIGNGVGNYMITPNLVTGTLSGTAGPTSSVSSLAVIGLVPQVMSGFMVQRAAGSDVRGRDVFKFFNAVSTGIVTVLQTAFLTGTAVGIGPGGGIGRFTTVNEQAISSLVNAQFVAKNITGRDAFKIANAIGFGIANHLRTSVTFSLVAMGAVAPVPPVGPVPVAGIPTVTTKIS